MAIMNWMRHTASGIGIAFGVLFLTFAIRLIDSPISLSWTFLVYSLPMLVAGILWVLHAAKSAKAVK